MAGSDKTVKVVLRAETAQYSAGMAQASASTSKLGNDVDAVGDKSKGFASKAGSAVTALKGMAIAGAAVAGTALVTFLGSAVSAAGDLEQSMGGVDAVFKDSAEQIHAFGETSAQSVGLSTNEFNTLITATGALLKNKGLEDFSNKSIDLVKIGADLAAQFGGSTTEAVDALNSAMRGEGNPIERYGITINQAAIQAELASKGLDKLTGSALEQAKATATIDIITRQSADALGTFAREADTLQGQQQRLNAEWENAKASLGGALLPAVTAATSAFRVGLDAVMASVGAFGALPGPVKAAVAALVAFRIAQATLGGAASTAIAAVRSLGTAISSAVATASGGATGFAGLRTAFTGLGGASGVARAGMNGLKSAGSAVMGLAGGPWGLAIAGLTLAITGYFQAQANAKKAAEDFAATLDKTTGSFTEASRQLAADNFFKDFAQTDYAPAAKSLEAAGAGVSDMIAAYQKGGPAIDEFKAKFDAWRFSAESIDLQRKGLDVVALGNSYAAAGRDIDAARVVQQGSNTAQDAAAAAAIKVKAATDQAAQAQKQHEAVLVEVKAATAQAFAQMKTYSAAVAAVKTAADAAKASNQNLATAMLAVRAAAGDADAAQIAYKAAVDKASASVKENGRTLDINTEKGRANKSALLDLKNAALTNAEAQLKSGRSVTQVGKEMDTARSAFIRAAVQSGANRAEAGRLADRYGLTRGAVNALNKSIGETPAQKKVRIEAETAQAQANLRAVQGTVNSLQGKTITVTTLRVTRDINTSLNSNAGRAYGGPINGAGSTTSDSIPIMASDGEFMMRAAARAKYGDKFMHDVNSLRLASGGPVGRIGSGGIATQAAQSMTGLSIVGTLDTEWGPAVIRGVVVDELASVASTARRQERQRVGTR